MSYNILVLYVYAHNSEEMITSLDNLHVQVLF